MRQLLRRVWYGIRQRRFETDLAEEMDFHREMKQREMVRGGAAPEEAALATRRALGSLPLARDRARDVWQPHVLQGIGADVRLAGRTLRATPIVSIVAVLSLALGIGANTAIFSLVNSLMLRSLPVRDPGRLVVLADSAVRYWRYPVWDQIRRQPGLFENAGACSLGRFNLAATGESDFVDGLWASGSYLDALGVRPVLGRILSTNDDQPGGAAEGPVMMISYGFWQRRLGGAPDVIGRRLTVNGALVSIVGVTPRHFFGTDVGRRFDVMLPIADEPRINAHDSMLNGGVMGLMIFGRLKPGQTSEAATSALRTLQPAIREATLSATAGRTGNDPYLRDYLKEPFTLLPAATGFSSFRGRYLRPLVMILGAAGLVLLLACANVANLLLARAAARRHELSVRVAIGASRWRLVRALLVESALLAATAAAAGMVIASWASRLLVRHLSTQTSPVFLDLPIDWRLLTFVTIVASATLLLFGIVPAIRASNVAPIDALKANSRGTAGRLRAGVSGGLVVAQVALSVALVVAGSLLVRTFVALVARDPGFASNAVLLVRIESRPTSLNPSQRMATYGRVLDAVRAVAGVDGAALSSMTPVGNLAFDPPIDVSGTGPLPPRERRVLGNVISPGWFSTLGIPLVAGRDLTPNDRVGTPPVAIVNQAFARRFLNGASPIDHTITLPALLTDPASNPPLRIVGVVADAVYLSLREPPRATIYLPLEQHDTPFFVRALQSVTLNVRSGGGSPARLTKSVVAAIAGVNPELAVTVRPLADQVNDSLARERVLAMLAGFFGVLGLLLAGLGLYGVTAYAVSRRRTEIGVRIALGASLTSVLRLVLSRVAALVGFGAAAGAIVSVSASRLLGTLLYGVEPRDPATLAGAVLLLAAIAACASCLPAWRAARTDPALVLREQ